MASSRCSFSANCERSAAGCHRCSTPVARRRPCAARRRAEGGRADRNPPAPAAEARVEAVDAIEIGAPDREVAGPRALPARGRSLRSGPSGRRSSGARRLRPPCSRCRSQRRQAPIAPARDVAQHRAGQPCVSGARLPVTNQPRSASAMLRRNPAAPGSRRRENDVVAARRADRAVADFAGAKTAMLVPDMGERHAKPRLPLLDQRGRGRPRAVVGHQDLEVAIVLARQRTQHCGERVVAVEGRDDDRDRAFTARAPSAMLSCSGNSAFGVGDRQQKPFAPSRNRRAAGRCERTPQPMRNPGQERHALAGRNKLLGARVE